MKPSLHITIAALACGVLLQVFSGECTPFARAEERGAPGWKA